MNVDLTSDEIEMLTILLNKTFTENVAMLEEYYSAHDAHETDVTLFKLLKKFQQLSPVPN